MRVAAALLALFAATAAAETQPIRPAPRAALDGLGAVIEFLKGPDGRVDRIGVYSGSSTIGRRKG